MRARRGVGLVATSVLAASAILAAGYALSSAFPLLLSHLSAYAGAIAGGMKKPVSEPFGYDSSQTVTSSLAPEHDNVETSLSPLKQSPLPTSGELGLYALELINADRAKAGLLPVVLSDNYAAQAQADDIIASGRLSHWMTNGEKPYMSYSRYGGTAYVSQNAAMCCYANESGFSVRVLSSQFYSPDDIKQAIRAEQDGMVNNDMSCCNNGHRLNILDAHHTGVSIGIAYSNSSVVMVQNFENNYLSLNRTISSGDNRTITITGKYIEKGYTIEGITVTFDNIPSHATYLEHLGEHSYSGGALVATVQKPSPQGYHYVLDHNSSTAIGAGYWHDAGSSFDIQFDLSKAIAQKGDGIYTVTVFLSSDGGHDLFPALTHSFSAGPNP